MTAGWSLLHDSPVSLAPEINDVVKTHDSFRKRVGSFLFFFVLRFGFIVLPFTDCSFFSCTFLLISF
jgi:hypothetical protein